MLNKQVVKKFTAWFPGSFLCQKKTNTAKAGFQQVQLAKNLKVPLVDANTDLYFYVNGGPKKEDVNRINAFFVDLDAGRDSNGKYFKKSIVDRKKTAMRKRIAEFPIKPSMVVETRNGYQVYWLTEILLNVKYKGGTNRLTLINKWETCQKRIASFFKNVGADPAVLKLNQILRVPGSTWYKSYEGKAEEFPVTIYKQYSTYIMYDLDDFANDTASIKIVKVNRNNASYKKPAAFIPIPVKVGVNQDNKLLHDVMDFLNEAAGLLYSKGAKYSSNQARELITRIQSTYHIS